MRWSHDVTVLFVCFATVVTLSGGPGPQTRPVRIVCLGGDSLARGGPAILWRLLQHSPVRAQIFNESRIGHNTWAYLQFMKAHYDRVRNLHPDIVLIQIGLQDSQIGRNHRTTAQFYNATLRIVRMAKTYINADGEPSIVLLATLPQLPVNHSYPYIPDSSRRVRAEFNPALRDLAVREAVVLVPMTDLESGTTPTRLNAAARRWYHALMPYLGIHTLPSLKSIWYHEV